jgi:hypothetical protein
VITHQTKQNNPSYISTICLCCIFHGGEETDLLSSDQTYTSKFYEPDVQAVIEQNRVVFEPDADAITDTPEANIVHSYDSINDR